MGGMCTLKINDQNKVYAPKDLFEIYLRDWPLVFDLNHVLKQWFFLNC